MKYSNYIGAAAALGVIISCFFPWVFIQPIDVVVTGFNAPKTPFGKPGMMNTIISSLSVILFLVPTLLAKRINLFVCAFNLAWSFRNYLLVTQCQLGECPVTRSGIYALLGFSLVMMVMSVLPKVELK
ncbi:hypothetical protein [Aridibaculum aurantiacum]|uniref:hypothetical protein n=1 Tax=Aridibaculum aurantiacum TaxID=2810307 RepID=UPI001A97C8A2|nr:hypothetical protein [Aridibaculum aurantiacum]